MMSRPSLTPPDSPLTLPQQPPPPSRRIWKRDKGTGRFKWIERACSGEVKASSTQIGEDLTLSLADAIKVDEGAQHQPPRQRPVPSEKKRAPTPVSLLNLPPPPFGSPKSEKKKVPCLPNLPPTPLGPPPGSRSLLGKKEDVRKANARAQSHCEEHLRQSENLENTEIDELRSQVKRLSSVERLSAVKRLSAELNASKTKSSELRSQLEVAKQSLDQHSKEENRTRYHTVKPGESFQFICLKYKVSANALRDANNISGSTLKPSQRLIIPSSPTTAIKGEEFKVDKLFSDALLYCRRHRHKKREDLSAEQKELIEAVDSISSPAAPKRPASIITTSGTTSITTSGDEEKVQYHEVQVRKDSSSKIVTFCESSFS